jgi:hypothetical protein
MKENRRKTCYEIEKQLRGRIHEWCWLPYLPRSGNNGSPIEVLLVLVNNVLDNVQYIQNNIKYCQRNKTLRNRIHAQSWEQYLSRWGLNICISNSAIGIRFYSRQGIDVDKVMKRNNLLIGHKHDKEIFVIERWSDINMARKYTWLKDMSSIN